MKTILAILLLSLLGSCYTARRAEKQTSRALRNHPVVVAKIARDAFPCVTTKSDTIYNSIDSLIWVECPPEQPLRPDTIRTITRIPVTLPLVTKYITIRIKDSAEIKTITSTLIKSDNQVQQLTGKVTRKNKVILWISFILVGASIPYIIKIAKLFI